MPRRHPLAPGMSHHAGTAAGVGTAAPGCCGVLGVGGSAWLFLAGCCGAQEGTSCLPAPAFLLLLLLLSSPALNLVTMATVSTTLQLPREDLPRGGGEREAGGGCWGHGDIALGTAVTLPRCGTVPARCVPWDEHCASCLGGGLWAYFPTPLPFAPSFPPSFPRRPFIPSLTLAHPGPGDNFRSFQLCTLLPSSPVQQVLPFLPVPSPPLPFTPPLFGTGCWHLRCCSLARHGSTCVGTAPGCTAGVGGGVKGGNGATVPRFIFHSSFSSFLIFNSF